MADYENKKHRAGTAAVLSFVLCGLGQMYIGQIKRGLTLIFWSSTFLLVMILGAAIVIHQIMTDFTNPPLLMKGIGLTLTGLITSAITGIYNIFDAYNGALKEE